MSEWRPIETAPKDGSWFLVWQDGEIYHAAYGLNRPVRLMWRTHQLWCPKSYRIIQTEAEGQSFEARVLLSEGPEKFEHKNTLWTRGFDFAPTHWMPLPEPPVTE